MYQSLFLSLSIYICKNGLDPDQIRKEFKTECFVNLKICACDRKYVPVSLSFSLYLHLQKRFGSRSDPNGIQD